MNHDYCVVLCTCPDHATAGALAEELVEQRLAACVNILPGVESVYRWEGRVERAGEWLLLIKTDRTRYEALQDYIGRHHPYETPEIIALPVTEGSTPYLQWLSACLHTVS